MEARFAWALDKPIGWLGIEYDIQSAAIARMDKELVCPYERFTYDSLRNFDKPSRGNVLVVWLPESDFSNYSLIKIALLLQLLEVDRQGKKESDVERRYANEQSEAARRDKARIDIIGPASSALLRSIIDDVGNYKKFIDFENTTDKDWLNFLDGVKFYSSNSTVEPNLLFDANKNESNKVRKTIESSLRSLLPDNLASLEYVRTAGTDGQLAGHLIGELRRRGVRLGLGEGEKGGIGDDITLVYEEDSFYGRAFRVTFAAAYDAIVNGVHVRHCIHQAA